MRNIWLHNTHTTHTPHTRTRHHRRTYFPFRHWELQAHSLSIRGCTGRQGEGGGRERTVTETFLCFLLFICPDKYRLLRFSGPIIVWLYGFAVDMFKYFIGYKWDVWLLFHFMPFSILSSTYLLLCCVASNRIVLGYIVLFLLAFLFFTFSSSLFFSIISPLFPSAPSPICPLSPLPPLPYRPSELLPHPSLRCTSRKCSSLKSVMTVSAPFSRFLAPIG